ncbi:hypothetical protein BpHYR1_001016 [Brachionus plicatilis]|uniref:Uncharacterized protein n=1 Tax=Brachionus plicatilis TaxID=10195 RepID=A0A3M7T7U3_BRAPC|nr:hypothetical protein BpHYR1_001016 [Brachionus plicatilis]
MQIFLNSIPFLYFLEPYLLLISSLKDFALFGNHLLMNQEGNICYCYKNEFKIVTGNRRPIKQRAYLVPYAKQELITVPHKEFISPGLVTLAGTGRLSFHKTRLGRLKHRQQHHRVLVNQRTLYIVLLRIPEHQFDIIGQLIKTIVLVVLALEQLKLVLAARYHLIDGFFIGHLGIDLVRLVAQYNLQILASLLARQPGVEHVRLDYFGVNV